FVGIEFVSGGSTHLASEQHLALTTGGHVGMAVGRGWVASIAQGARIFVHRLGVKLVAASGKIRIEAQQDGLELIARRAIDIMSTTDWIKVNARQGIRLNGGGTELGISAKGIIGFTDGAFRVHASDHQTANPLAKPVKLPLADIRQAKVAEHFVLMEHGSGLRLPGQRYRIALADGQLIDGTTNELGETALVLSESMQMATLAFLRNDGTDNPIAVHTPMLIRGVDMENNAPPVTLDKRVADRQQIGARSAPFNEV